jgi:hypothetical protein
MRKTGLPLILFGLLLVLSLHTTSAYAQATRTWVSGVGDDANPCSRTAPCKTFAGAISKTAAGGEIDCLDPGGFGAVTITKSMTIDCGPNAGGVLNSGSNGIVVNAGVSDKIVLRNIFVQGGNPGGVQGTNGIRFLGGKELHLDNVTVIGQSILCVDVNDNTTGFVYVRRSYFSECPTGINLASSVSGFIIAEIDRSYFNGTGANGVVAAGASVFANVSNSVFTNNGLNGVSASVSGAHMSVSTSVFANNSTAISAVSGANLRTSTNILNDNTTGISASGASWLTAGDNKVAGGTTPSVGTSAAVPLL